MSLDKALDWFIGAWVALALLVNAASIFLIVAGAPTIWDGLLLVREIYNPFNVWNGLAEILLLSPAVAAFTWKNKRLKS